MGPVDTSSVELPAAPGADSGQWFVQDRPIDDAGGDAFDHLAVAQQLALMIQELRPPATIGLTGGFGTGKSSIGQLLRTQLSKHPRFAVVAVSIEKHSGAERQRALVHAIADALVAGGHLSDANARKALAHLSAHETTQRIDVSALFPFRLRDLARRNLVSAALKVVGVGAAVYAIAFGLVLAYTHLRGWHSSAADDLHDVFTSFYAIAAALVVVSMTLLERTPPPQLSTERPRAEAADEFERVFEDLVSRCDKRTMCIEGRARPSTASMV